MVSIFMDYFNILEEQFLKTFDLLNSKRSSMVFQLMIKCGPKEFFATIDASEETNGCDVNSSNTDDGFKPLKTIQELRQFIAEQLNCDPGSMKIIYKGKFIGTLNDSELLSTFKFKPKDKLMVISGGPVKASTSETTVKKAQTSGGLIQEDKGFQALLDYEKKHLIPLNQQFEDNGQELSELERNFLEGEQRKEMLNRMDKQLRLFTEVSIRHMESIDGIQIYGAQNTSMPETQRQKNREKRKSLINGIQDLMNRNDKYLFRLSQYSFKTEHPDEGR